LLNAKALRSHVEHVERLVAGGASDEAVRLALAEAADAGFSSHAIEALVRERRLRPDERDDLIAALDVYRVAIGDEPLEAAVERVIRAEAARPPR
jgi:uncharacterized protein (UPF0335 family)